MKVTFSDKKFTSLKSQALILPIYKSKKLSKETKEADKKLGGLISEIIKEGYYTPELGEVHVIYSYEKIKVKKIILLGLGKKKELTCEGYYKAISSAIAYVGKTNIRSCAVYIGKKEESKIQNIIEVSLLALYRFHYYKSKKKSVKLNNLIYVYKGRYNQRKLDEIANLAQIIVEAVYFARDLANQPSNILTPKKLASEAQKIAKFPIKIRIFGEKELKDMGLELLLSVAKGSDEEAQLAILDYKPKKYKKTIGLVGKGITFDTGGSTLKPTYPVDSMQGMNMDMSGAAAIIGTFLAISKLKPKNIRIIGAIPTTENMISGKSQKPGDVWHSHNGKTVEVVNTDAEGRLVLADALSYIQKKYKPSEIIDIGTLTGGCIMALGHEYSGVFGNRQKLIDKLLALSQESYEKLWQLPINKEFHNELKSDVADLRNIGCGKEGSAIKCAAFLEEFINPKTAWVHIDIAGPAIQMKPQKAYFQKGGTGAGVKTLIEFINKIIPN